MLQLLRQLGASSCNQVCNGWTATIAVQAVHTTQD